MKGTKEALKGSFSGGNLSGVGSDVSRAEGVAANGDAAYREAIVREGVGEGGRVCKAKIVLAVNGCFGLVEGKIVSLERILEVNEQARHAVAVFGGDDKANVVDDGGPNGLGEAIAVAAQDVGEGGDEEKRAEGVPLRNALLQVVLYGVVDVKGGRGVSSKVNAGGGVEKETKPRREERAVDKLHGFPQVFLENIVKSFLKVARYDSAALLGCSLRNLDEGFAAARHSDAQVKHGD
jgi:hypothetical protein